MRPCYEQLANSTLDGHEGVSFLGSMQCTVVWWQELGPKSEGPLYEACDKYLISLVSEISLGPCKCFTQERIQKLLPIVTALVHDSDPVVAASTLHLFGLIIAYTPHPIVGISHTPESIQAVLSLMAAVWDLGQPVSWWSQRWEAVNLDTLCLGGCFQAAFCLTQKIMEIPPQIQTQWTDVISRVAHAVKISQSLSRQHTPVLILYFGVSCVAKLASLSSDIH
eukprot:SAG25_NODE_1554_length_2772_cov_2.934530_1_plen_222_part_10